MAATTSLSAIKFLASLNSSLASVKFIVCLTAVLLKEISRHACFSGAKVLCIRLAKAGTQAWQTF